MMQFGFRWLSLSNLTEVQSLFPMEKTQDGETATPYLAGISRMRLGDTWDENTGIAVAMVRMRDGGRFNRHEVDLSKWLQKRAAEKLPSNCWGDFYLSLGQFLEVMRIRSEFRIALAAEAVRDAESRRCVECILEGRDGPLADVEDQPLERALAAIREVAGVPFTFRLPPSRRTLTEAGIAESCARRILKTTGPFVKSKHAVGISQIVS